MLHLIWADPEKGLRKKRHLERDIVQFETFLEAIMSTLVMTYLLMRATSYAEGFEIIYNPWDPNPRNTVVFFLAFASSVITSSLGLAKNLRAGPCRILPDGGLLSPRFVIIFFACLFTLVGKGIGLCSTVFMGFTDCKDTNLVTAVFTVIVTFFLPGFLTGILASPHKGFLKTFLSHPSVFLLPTFSHFTFSTKKPCRQGGDAAEGERFISFSPNATAINISVNVAFVCGNLLINSGWGCYLRFYVYVGLPLSILGFIFTMVAAFLDKCGNDCSCSCCSCCFQPYELGALVVSSPQDLYILGPDGELVKEGDFRVEENMEREELVPFEEF